MNREILDTATPDELTEALTQLHAAECAIRAALLEVVAAYDRRVFWHGDGAASMAGWLVAGLGLARHTANDWVRAARDLQGLPRLAAAFGEGRLSWDQVRAASRFATPETDAAVAADTPSRSVSQLERAARRAGTGGEPVPNRKERSLRWWWERDGRWLRIAGRLPDDDGALVARALERAAEGWPRDPVTGVFEPYSARCADALVEIASAGLAADADADRATLVVHVGASDLVAGTGCAEIEGGPLLDVETARRLGCDARVQLAVDGVGVGRTTRRVPPWLSRQVRHRDKGCRFPGCERTRWTHAHHLVHWAQGGPTDLDNLVLLCSFHHRLVHEGGWRIAGHPGRKLTFLHPDGTPLRPGPRPLRREVRRRIVDPVIPVGPGPPP
jgi:hypothetical protein